jgi:hypothetical protein
MIMAGRDGWMLFCAMRGIQNHAAIPVAIITEFADDPSKRQRDNGRRLLNELLESCRLHSRTWR